MLALTTINTDRLLLRPHQMADLARITNFFMSPICTQFMLIPKEMQNPEGAKQGLEFLIQSYVSPQPIFALTIADAASDKFWGFCQLWPHDQPKMLELVYAVIPEKQGFGIATEGAQAVTRYALSTSEVDEVVAFVIPENVASVKVVENLRFDNDGPAVHHGRSSLRFRARKGIWH
jgi:ribosomal-protein-alanine N-acetyltransferase